MTDQKPHKGKITNWTTQPVQDCGLGYLIVGEFVNHPDFGNAPNGHTSWVEKHDRETGEIETRNSRYTLVGPETKN